MKSFLFVLCTALLLNGVAVANKGAIAPKGGKVAKWWVNHVSNNPAIDAAKKAAVIAGAVLAIGVATCGLQGCDNRAQNIVSDVVQEKPTSLENPFKIGVIYEHEFVQSWYGAQLAALQANRAGGIDGREIVLYPKTIYDRDTAFAVRVTQNLINKEDVDAIVGANYSYVSEFVDEVVVETNLPMVAMGSTSYTLTRAGPSIFLSAAPDTFQARVSSKYALEELNAKTAAILYWQEDAYSKGLAEAYRDSYNALGGKVVSFQGYSYGVDVKDHVFAAALNDGGIINDVVNAQPDVVFIPGFLESAIVAVQLRGAGEDAILFGADGWGASGGAPLIAMGGKALEGAYYTDGFTPAAAPEFTKAYQDAYGSDPDFLSASGYDATNIVIQAALRTADNITNETLTQEIAATANYEGATTIYRYDIKRHPVKALILNQIVDRKTNFLKTIDP